ncbi:MAG: hypothetical protein LCH84_06525 [Gemmatimonadetes bacterium]|nr:hypothetical protein [Gemmatimonadota bacterium]
MGVLAESCGNLERTYFHRAHGEPRVVTLTAVVVQRRLEPLWTRNPIGALGVLAALFRRSRPTPPPKPSHEDDPARRWTSASNIGQPTEVCFSDDRRVVRVAGREFAVPLDPRTFVVLVDEVPGDPDNPRIVTTLIDVPPRPDASCPAPDRAERGQARVAWMRESQHAWAAAIDADPIVRRFLEARAHHQVP